MHLIKDTKTFVIIPTFIVNTFFIIRHKTLVKDDWLPGNQSERSLCLPAFKELRLPVAPLSWLVSRHNYRGTGTTWEQQPWT